MERALFSVEPDSLPAGDWTHLYFGSEFCSWTFPDKKAILRAVETARAHQLAFCLVTPVVSEPFLPVITSYSIHYTKLYELPMHPEAYPIAKNVVCGKDMNLLELSFASIGNKDQLKALAARPASCATTAIDENIARNNFV